MRYLVSASEMREYDSNTIERIGIPACVLMERAALAAVEAIEEFCAGGGRGMPVLVMAGMGNNGGDGLAVARLLCEKGYRVEVWTVGDRERASGQWKQQMGILENYPVEYSRQPRRREYGVLVDALFGVGLSRAVEGLYAEAIDVFRGLSGWRLAIDMPSGIGTDTGEVLGRAAAADLTVTFGFCKRGLALYPGCEYAGEVRIADIGISGRSFFGRRPGMYAYDEDICALLPKRDGAGNKGTFGKVLLAAGSVNMAGAAVLAARAAYRAGAGMVKVITPPENRIILQQAVPEALLGTCDDLEAGLEWADVAAVGPGLGKSREALRCLERMVRQGGKPLLVDADGLNLLSEQPGLQELLTERGRQGRAIVLTPHVGELARLLGCSVQECKRDLPAAGGSLAARLNAVVAAKDARTFICREGHGTCVNLNGNSGMATAGSGDVLTGIIAALLAQGMEAFEAAAVGAYVHGRAGDLVTARVGPYACTAGDMAEAVGRIGRVKAER
ncbi:MAG: NAD(P)H-hydrate dehydratase [Lachnospiraceae bacterium]|nr:NAD(P)H-hydrate dehydratase [uncultured Acetatifactor sp.]MCI9231597.1 NAD(P)H-hydrate dehydratase [Lachnospiraceae bacterium]